MTTARRKPARRRSAARPSSPGDIWQARPALPDLEPITVPDEPSALIRSLGDPPLANGSRAAGYVTAVVERAAVIAGALALSADLPSKPDGDTAG